jgi:DNA-binding IscR family transcriptional regulator
MQAMQPVPITLPKKPRIKQKEQQPDQRQFSIVPIRAITDRRLTGMEMRVLMMYCCYTNRSGLTWVGQQRIATHLNVSKMRVSVLTTALVNKGYLKVVYQGFRGERADTRQVIYKAELDLADIVAVTNEPAPYMIEQQQKIQLNQPVKGQRMAKRKAVKVNDQVITDLELNDSDSHLGLDCQLEAIRKAVGSEILAAAQQQAGPAATVADIERILSKMLT